MTQTLTLRLTAPERRALQDVAAAAGKPLGDWARGVLFGAAGVRSPAERRTGRPRTSSPAPATLRRRASRERERMGGPAGPPSLSGPS